MFVWFGFLEAGFLWAALAILELSVGQTDLVCTTIAHLDGTVFWKDRQTLKAELEGTVIR